MIYGADFETYTVYKGTTPVEAFVQGFYIENMYDENDNSIGVTMAQFLNFVGKIKEDSTIYFHNLSFDGSYIVAELLRRGYKQSENTFIKWRQYALLMDANGSIYSIKIRTTRFVEITLKCSLK